MQVAMFLCLHFERSKTIRNGLSLPSIHIRFYSCFDHAISRQCPCNLTFSTLRYYDLLLHWLLHVWTVLFLDFLMFVHDKWTLMYRTHSYAFETHCTLSIIFGSWDSTRSWSDFSEWSHIQLKSPRYSLVELHFTSETRRSSYDSY